MIKKVNFYKVDLFETLGTNKDYKALKELLPSIIEKHAVSINDFLVLDLTMKEDLHYTADIFDYKDRLLIRLGNEKPAGSFLLRNYNTNMPSNILDSKDPSNGIEVYTYILLDYNTGVLAIVNHQSAPSYKILNYFFAKYLPEYYINFTPIPNPDGIDRIYYLKEPKISNVEVEVPIPSAEVLEKIFNWKTKDILDIQGKGLKATLKLSSIERKPLTTSEKETIGLLDCIKKLKSMYTKAKVRAKAEGIKTMDYSFFDENFSYPIEISTYTIKEGKKIYHSANELIPIYCENLIMSFNENKPIIIQLIDR